MYSINEVCILLMRYKLSLKPLESPKSVSEIYGFLNEKGYNNKAIRMDGLELVSYVEAEAYVGLVDLVKKFRGASLEVEKTSS